MKSELEAFTERINDFETLSASDMIPFFTYFLSGKEDKNVSPSEIMDCFYSLSIKPYSNVAAYLSKKSSGKNTIFIKGLD